MLSYVYINYFLPLLYQKNSRKSVFQGKILLKKILKNDKIVSNKIRSSKKWGIILKIFLRVVQVQAML